MSKSGSNRHVRNLTLLTTCLETYSFDAKCDRLVQVDMIELR